jgi:hypothetical protein
MKHSFYLATVLCAGIGVATATASAQQDTEPVAPISVQVDGQQIGSRDIEAFISGYYQPKAGSPRMKTIVKDPSAMPPDAPYASYQGREPGPPPVEVVWVSSAIGSMHHLEEERAADEQYMAAAGLAVMDAGNAGSALQAVFAKTPSDRASRLALGLSFARAFQSASDQSAAFAASQAEWIRTNISLGTTRAAAYTLLKSKGLTAYNWAFVKGRPIPPSHGSTGGCDATDWASAAWPYKGEPLPKEQGGCADLTANRPRSIPNPDADLELSGAFNVACGWTTDVVIAFGDDDRVKAVRVDAPHSECL